ncbi:amino acid adenylation domain-containing protein [Umezawaea sp. Da 62-37]|uniref:amino acid adenylation domain-containing protein n=1 Tax=Umezawaea sp. Da 62-37 TaxID=3075927 RepID=UPI0028F74A18|nr:amino acid adenylation domain-containing protein [Umezawaea sp. Da 62-37]WNV84693.1 amino acid adenylation domain-containing protein [Umezawaea sp. Da 62-37]
MKQFDDPGGVFSVLLNEDGQYSLWPAALSPPAGWDVVHGDDFRQACLDHIEEHWTDLRPRGARLDFPLPTTAHHTRPTSSHDSGTVRRCIHRMVTEQAARTPDAIAISYRGRVLTYRELDDASDELAQRVRSAGVRGGAVVVVVLERTATLIVTLLAVLKAGGAYLYLDPAELAEQRARVVRDAGARFAVVSADTAVHAPDVPTVLRFEDVGTGPVVPVDAPEVVPDTPAYVCYTSGSTGEPKGVVVPHRAIHRLIDAPSWIDVQDDDVFLQMTRVGFDVSTFEIWMPLVRGNRLALAPQGFVDLAEIAELVRAERITVLWLTTGLFHQIVNHQVDCLAGVRHLLAGGDVLSPEHVRRVLAVHPHLVFTNGYGPTENTTFTTCWTTRVGGDAPRVPIGVPIDGTTVAVLDDAMRPVPRGEVGELWVGGDGVATGYLNKPGATAEKFVADVDPDRPGGRMYRTGDLVRWSEDGTLDFLGRADRQVKIRGYRVEPSTVEMELLRQPGVEQAAVLVHDAGPGDARLAAYVAVGTADESGWTAFGTALRERLRETLPPHLVPWAIVVLSDIPLNGNGKVNRSALPRAKVPRNVPDDYVAPADPVERRLAEIWSDTLLVEPVGVHDNFFDLDGHSLLAADLLVALQEEFGVALPARTLFLRPTIAALAEELRKHDATNPLEAKADAAVR